VRHCVHVVGCRRAQGRVAHQGSLRRSAVRRCHLITWIQRAWSVALDLWPAALCQTAAKLGLLLQSRDREGALVPCAWCGGQESPRYAGAVG
ncbi:MAG TPA: hypothetical protein VGL02_22660, partial [Streptomyces sp.]